MSLHQEITGVRPPVPVAASSCLLGAEVRYDGRHKRDGLCHEALEGLFELRGFCPEVGIGMSVPRDPIQLVGDPSAPRAVGVEDPSLDVTEALRRFAGEIGPQLEEVCGYIFIRGSPSCGLEEVPVFTAADEPSGAPDGASRAASRAAGQGIHAAAVTSAWPELPVEQNDRLQDPETRERFLTRVFCYAHWRRLEAAGLTAAGLTSFHARYKYLLLAHSTRHYQRTGRLLADLHAYPDEVARRYLRELMEGLAQPATPGGHANAMEHLAGHVGDALAPQERRALAWAIQGYRRGSLPRRVPLDLLRDHIARRGDAYVNAQLYLEPYPGAPRGASHGRSPPAG